MHPILDALVASGDIVIIDDQYIGFASDGVEVLIGQVGRESVAEIYLTDFPSPQDW